MGELRYRVRVNIVMDKVIFNWLSEKTNGSQQEGKSKAIKSRVIEDALLQVYGKEIEEFKNRPPQDMEDQ